MATAPSRWRRAWKASRRPHGRHPRRGLPHECRVWRARAAELRSSHDTDATAEETEGNEETVQAERKEVELEFKWADKDANGRLSFDEYLHGKVYTRPFDLVVGWNPPRPRYQVLPARPRARAVPMALSTICRCHCQLKLFLSLQ